MSTLKILRKIWIDIVKYENEIRLNSIELQLIGYSWPDPTRHAVEFVLFTVNKGDDYTEKICEVILFLNWLYSGPFILRILRKNASQLMEKS